MQRRPTSAYPHIYRRLKAIGHTAQKAAEILLDACRGDEWSISWIKMAFRTRVY